MNQNWRALFTPKPYHTAQEIQEGLWISALGYGLLLIPTVLVHLEAWHQNVDVSRLMDQVWSLVLWLPKGWGWLSDFLIVVVGGTAAYHYWRLLNTQQQNLSAEARLSIQTILVWTAIFAVLLSGVIPFHSRDVFGYINRGAEQAVYGVNPYLVTVEGIKTWHHDPLFHEHWIHNPCPYGFFFAQATAWMVELGGKTFWGAFLVSKLINAALYTGVTFLIYQLVLSWNESKVLDKTTENTEKVTEKVENVQQDVLDPATKNQALYAAMMFGWNPLMLLHLVGNGHNDLWVGGGLVLTLFFAFSERYRPWMWPAFILTALVKYTVLLLLPLLLIWSWQNRKHLKWGQTFSLSAITLLFCIWPYAQDLPVFPWDKILENATLSQHSFHSALSRLSHYVLIFFLGPNVDIELIRKSMKWLLCAVVIGALFESIRRLLKSASSDLRALAMRWGMAVLMVSFLLVASAKFHAWYIGSFFPLLCLFPKGHFFQRLGLWLTVFQLGAFTFLENIHILNALLLNGVPLAMAYYDSRKTVINPAISSSCP